MTFWNWALYWSTGESWAAARAGRAARTVDDEKRILAEMGINGASESMSTLREMGRKGIKKRRRQHNTEDGWTGYGGDEMDKVKTLAEKLDPCIVGDIGAY